MADAVWGMRGTGAEKRKLQPANPKASLVPLCSLRSESEGAASEVLAYLADEPPEITLKDGCGWKSATVDFYFWRCVCLWLQFK